MRTLNEYDLKELIRIISEMKEKEWESFKTYVDHKFKMVGKIENTELTFDTLKTFFLEIKKTI